MNLHNTFPPAMVRDLIAIEAARQTVRLSVLLPQATARFFSTHYSTHIEGNRLLAARKA